MNYLKPSECLPEVETPVIVWGNRHGKKVWATAIYEDGTIRYKDSKYWWFSDCCGYNYELDNHFIDKGWYSADGFFKDYLNFQVEYWAKVERPQ